MTLICIYFYGCIATFEVGIKKSDIEAKEETLLEFLLFGVAMVTDAKGELVQNFKFPWEISLFFHNMGTGYVMLTNRDFSQTNWSITRIWSITNCSQECTGTYKNSI